MVLLTGLDIFKLDCFPYVVVCVRMDDLNLDVKEGKLGRESPKRTISASGELELLQMGKLRRESSKRTISASGELGLWYQNQTLGIVLVSTLVRSHIGWRRERNIPYKGVKTYP
ncbi:hypothetical protein SDJN02_22666, partial [Cucurbita argyrosperma subsp. argyrosperma]